MENKVSPKTNALTLTACILASDLYMAELAINVMPLMPKQVAEADTNSVISVKSNTKSGNSHTS